MQMMHDDFLIFVYTGTSDHQINCCQIDISYHWLPFRHWWQWRLLHWQLSSPSMSLQWRYNERDGVSNHQPHDCLLNRFFRRRSKKISKLRVTGLCEGNSPVTGEFPAQRTSNAENVSIWWRHHVICRCLILDNNHSQDLKTSFLQC